MRKTILFIAFLCLISTANAATLQVGSGNQDTINQVIKSANYGDVVQLSKGTYTITAPIYMRSGICLKGDDTTIYVPNKANFNSESEAAMIMGNNVNDIEICSIKFVGPGLSPEDVHDTSQTYYGGHGAYHNAMRFTSCRNIKIHDCSCELLLNDFVRTSKVIGIDVYNNVISHGHDGCQIYNSRDVNIYNNYIIVFINCGVRISSSDNALVTRNTFTSYSASGWNGVQIQGDSTATVTKNVFTKMYDNIGVIGLQTNGNGCVITDNVGYKVQAGLIGDLSGAKKSNNVMYDSEQDWISMERGYNGDGVIISHAVKPLPVVKENLTTENITVTENVTANVTENVIENVTVNTTNNVTEENETDSIERIITYLQPKVVQYDDVVIKVYQIPQNDTPLAFEGEVTITKSE